MKNMLLMESDPAVFSIRY